MDLPTYTNIWRIEKRLYKLYDFRLPAPLPINWIAVFTGITVPYIVLLVAIGLPFSHSLVWLYVLPPGVLTWLTTRPVIESKRLPELLESQIRYLTEPRVWCRLAPLSEKDQIVVTARVWHSRRAPRQRKAVAEVALRERGTLARRNRGPATTTAAPASPSVAPASPSVAPASPSVAPASPSVAATAAAAASSVAATTAVAGSVAMAVAASSTVREPSRQRAPARARGASAQAPAPAAPGRSRPADPRPPAGRHPAVMRQAPPAAGSQPPSDTPAAAKPGRFRLAALRSKPSGPAPALPGVAPNPPASPWPARPADPASLVTAPAAHRPPAPAEHPAPLAQPPQPPQLPPSAMAPHATPDVYPMPPARERGRGTSAPHIEVSHSGRAQRLTPPPTTPASPPPSVATETEDKSPAPPSAPDLLADSGAREHESPKAAPDAPPQVHEQQRVPSVERALSGPSRDRNLTWHGKVKIVAGATQGPGARDQEALDRARARLPLGAPKRVIMLGCTSGAGQTVTALMTGYMLASLREMHVAAVDLHDGSLARYCAPAGWLEEILGGKAPRPPAPARADGLNPAHRDSPARLDVIASHEVLRDGDERRLAEHLGKHYPLTMLDPGAAGLTKLLTVADQLVVVVPASAEAAGALADTRDWLDAHGFADLASHSVTLINGVSRRSMPDVAQAEGVARGRCRAIVRVPWDDMLPVGVTGPSTLRPQTRVAYTALAGVLVAGMAAAPIRNKQ